jgi:hypothetical protein
LALRLASASLGSLPFPLAALLIALASVPLYVSLAYFDSLKDALLYQNLSGKGLLGRFLGRRLASNLVSATLALLLAAGLVLNLAALGPGEWPFVFLALPIQLALFRLFRWLTQGELDPWQLSPYFSSRAASWLAPLLALLAYTLALGNAGSAPPAQGPLGAVASQPGLFPGSPSALMRALGEWYRLLGGGRDFALGLARPSGFWPWFLLNLAFKGTLFFGVGALLRLVTIPRGDLGRLASKAALRAPRAGFLGFFLAAALPPLLVCSLFFPLSLRLELLASGEPGRRLESYRRSFEGYLILMDGEYYGSGILLALAEENRSMGALMDGAKARLRAEADRIFDGYRGNVDGYLDWYYSLPAEYSRLLSLAMGEIEGFMEHNLASKLGEGVDATGIHRVLSEVNAYGASARVQAIRRRFLYDGPVGPQGVLALRPRGLGRPALGQAFLMPGQMRRLVAATGGLAAGLGSRALLKRLVKRIVASTVFKQGLKALVRGLGYAALATAGGAAAGIVGVGASILIDKLILSLEEAVNREDFRRGILESIEAQRSQAHRLIDQL